MIKPGEDPLGIGFQQDRFSESSTDGDESIFVRRDPIRKVGSLSGIDFERQSHVTYLTTMFTSLSGMAITLTTVLPSV